jgi:hypothetical protein
LEFPRRVNSQPGIGIVGGLSRFDYDTRIALNPYYSLLSNYYTSVNIEIAKDLLMGTDSLICAKASLMGRLNSLLGRNKFPAPMRRELARKHLTLLPYSAYPLVVLWPIRPKFPANSQLAGNFGLSETGSLMTVSSSAESANYRFLSGGAVSAPPLAASLYSASLTCVPQAVPWPYSPASDSAKCEKRRSGEAPCQCIVSGGILTVSPGFSTCGFSPLKQMRPTPDKRKSVCPTGWECHAVRAPLAAMALSPWYSLAFVLLLIGGLGTAAFSNLQTTLILTEASPAARSRVMGIVTMCIGTGPVGVMMIGILSGQVGSPVAILIMAGFGLCGLSLVWRKLIKVQAAVRKRPQAKEVCDDRD